MYGHLNLLNVPSVFIFLSALNLFNLPSAVVLSILSVFQCFQSSQCCQCYQCCQFFQCSQASQDFFRPLPTDGQSWLIARDATAFKKCKISHLRGVQDKVAPDILFHLLPSGSSIY